MVLRERLDNHGDPLAAADARSGQSIARAAAPQFQQNRQHQSGSARGERMAESDGAAVYVHFLAIQAQTFFHRQILRGEGFIHFDEIHLIQFQSGE